MHKIISPFLFVSLFIFSCFVNPSLAQAQSLSSKAQEKAAAVASADDVKAPQFPGGENEMLKFLAMNTKYPTRAQLTKTAGFVVMQVTIDETGKVKDIKAAHADSPLLDKEPLRVLKLMPRWKPALHKEIPVSSTYLFPFRFNMEGAAESSKALPENYLTEISRKIKADAPNHPVFLSEEVTVTGFGASR